jgi:adenylosuccinate lyase
MLKSIKKFVSKILYNNSLENFYHNSLSNISSTDGRNVLKTLNLKPFLSEFALYKYRVKVEIIYLFSLCETIGVNISFKEKEKISKIYKQFSKKDAEIISSYDHFGYNDKGPFEHDVKAAEVFIQDKLSKLNLDRLSPYIHFCLTSEDVNNLAYSCMLNDALNEVWKPVLMKLFNRLLLLSKKYKEIIMLSRTHGQPASPTTFGKEMAVFLNRIDNEIDTLNNIKLTGKLNGAVGNFNAHCVVFHNVDWIDFSQKFVKSLNLEPELITIQRGPKNKICELFHSIYRINNTFLS